MPHKKVWSLNDAANADESDTPRWVVDVRTGVNVRIAVACDLNARAPRPKRPLLYDESNVGSGPEDVPWGGNGIIVSTRLRAFIEDLDPKAAKYVPVTIKRLDGSFIRDQYFQMAAFRRVDCIDEERSSVVQACVVRSMVPDDCHIFRVKHHRLNDLVASDVLRRMVKREGFTGLQFYRQLQCATK